MSPASCGNGEVDLRVEERAQGWIGLRLLAYCRQHVHKQCRHHAWTVAECATAPCTQDEDVTLGLLGGEAKWAALSVLVVHEWRQNCSPKLDAQGGDVQGVFILQIRRSSCNQCRRPVLLLWKCMPVWFGR